MMVSFYKLVEGQYQNILLILFSKDLKKSLASPLKLSRSVFEKINLKPFSLSPTTHGVFPKENWYKSLFCSSR